MASKQTMRKYGYFTFIVVSLPALFIGECYAASGVPKLHHPHQHANPGTPGRPDHMMNLGQIVSLYFSGEYKDVTLPGAQRHVGYLWGAGAVYMLVVVDKKNVVYPSGVPHEHFNTLGDTDVFSPTGQYMPQVWTAAQQLPDTDFTRPNSAHQYSDVNDSIVAAGGPLTGTALFPKKDGSAYSTSDVWYSIRQNWSLKNVTPTPIPLRYHKLTWTGDSVSRQEK